MNGKDGASASGLDSASGDLSLDSAYGDGSGSAGASGKECKSFLFVRPSLAGGAHSYDHLLMPLFCHAALRLGWACKPSARAASSAVGGLRFAASSIFGHLASGQPTPEAEADSQPNYI